MEVLKTTKFALRLGNLSNKNGFHLHKWRIPNIIVNLLFMLPMFICCIQMAIFCYHFSDNLKIISSAIYLGLGIMSVCGMYACLALNNDLIIDTLEHLQSMVSQSKHF